MSIYELLASIYDKLNEDIDYETWADAICHWLSEYSATETKTVLDLGCGTGSMTIPMAKRGYDMIGLDLSSEMLSQARERAVRDGITDILWTLQDMTAFELYNQVDGVISCLDSVNHLWEKGSLAQCFQNVSTFLKGGSLFIFDVNSQLKFEEIYGDQVYALETEDAFCVWQNDYNEATRLCDFYITLFSQTENGTYVRSDSVQTERFYTLRQIKNALNRANMDLVTAFGDLDEKEIDEQDHRWYIVARKREK